MAIELVYSVDGFWNDSLYNSYILSLMKEYMRSFGAAVRLSLRLTEEIGTPVGKSKITIDEDGGVVSVIVSVRRHDTGGAISPPPSPYDAPQEVRFWLNKAVTEYRIRFSI